MTDNMEVMRRILILDMLKNEMYDFKQVDEQLKRMGLRFMTEKEKISYIYYGKI